MIIVATFQHSIELEQALAVLENSGYSRKQFLVIAMDSEARTSMDMTNPTRDLHSKGMEVGMACATGFAVIGASIGFILKWGPVIWGLIASFIGFGVAYGMTYLFSRRGSRARPAKELPEITVIVQCLESGSDRVREIMWQFQALTVGRYPEPD